jgi:diguanylate cyclase (GGDEF)-like protein
MSYRHIVEVFDQWNRVASLFELGHEKVNIYFPTEFDEREAYFQLKVYKNGTSGMVCLISDVSDFKDLMDHLQYLAYHDKLTGLANRAMFEQGFEVLRKKAIQNNKNIALMMIDMHGLKKINDQYGHDKGDAVIKVFATYLEAELPDDVILARLSGDEFVAAFYDKNNEELRKIGDSLIKKLLHDSSSEYNEILINCSIGISCCYNVKDVKLRSVLMKRADTALYAAKKSDEHKIVVWDDNSAFK